MNLPLRLVFTLFIFSIQFLDAFAQEATLKGKIKDASTGETLPGVNIVLEDKAGTVSDMSGKYILKTTTGKHTVTFSFIGYKTATKDIVIEQGKEFTLNIDLKTAAKELQIFTVTGSQYEKRLSEETVSMDVISSSLIKNTNARELSEVVYKTPGVNVQDGQVSIRGGSSFSYGVGSRVAILIDNQGATGGDLGDAKWKFVPIENAEQVEVIKGASSVLYGSSALNGVINVQTGWAKETPQTEATLFSGIYEEPKRKELVWWNERRQPWFWGGSVNHRHRFKNLDVVLGANVNYNFNYLENADERRGRISFKTKYTEPTNKRTNFGLNGAIMLENSTRFFLPVDLDSNALRKLDGSTDEYTMVMLDPHYMHFDKNNNRHIVRGRWFNVFRIGRGETPDANSNLFAGEYQFQSNVKNKIFVTSGVMGTYGFSTSNLYANTRITYSGAVYSQVEYKPVQKLTLVGGLRYEISAVDTFFQATKPVFRTGLNWEAGKTTNIRASWGQAYRLPSVGERYIDANFAGGVYIVPNPDLKPETGWSAEVGVKQGLKLSNWMGYFDATIFWMEYANQVVYTFGRYTVDSTSSSGQISYFQAFGLRPYNVSNSRVAGFEVSLIGKGKIGPVSVSTFGGYTYSYPGDLDSDSTQKNVGTYVKNMFKYYGRMDSADAYRVMVLVPKHTFRFDLQLDYKKISVGSSIFYNSYSDRIPGIYYLILPGLDQFSEKRKKGDFVVDARIAYKANDHIQVSFMAKNLTNLEYANRPGVMNPPRNYTLQLRYNF